MTKEKEFKSTPEWKDFYAITEMYGKGRLMRDRLATKWYEKYVEVCICEGLKCKFWLLVDDCEDVNVAFEKLKNSLALSWLQP